MEHGKQKRELYDLSADPGEKNDVIEKYPAVVQALTDRITGMVRHGRSTPGHVQPNDTPPWPDLKWMGK